jgi:hypothetical protein
MIRVVDVTHEYDVVFLAPKVAGLVSYMLPNGLAGLGVAPFVAIPVSTGLSIWLIVLLPPSWEDWYFTGHHRGSVV